jgi:hypothetical protein
MAFSGKATYDNFTLIGEDVSNIVKLISPYETPFLDLLGDPGEAAASTAHQWTEEQLGVDTVINSTVVDSATADTGIQINATGGQLQVGMLLELQGSDVSKTQNEIVQIISIPGANSILVSRNFAAAGISSLVAGTEMHVLSTAELEGSTTSGDVTRARSRSTNYTQIFKKPVTISGTDRAVLYAPDLGDEFEHQAALRTREVLRDLEKITFRGRASGNSIGSGTAYRTMNGLVALLTTINSRIVASSFTADPLLYTNNLLQSAWSRGARDIDVIAVGAQWKRDLSSFASTSFPTPREQGAAMVVRHDLLSTDFGTVKLVLTPWLRARQLLGVATNRLQVKPLRGRSFAFEQIAKTGDSFTGHVIGEYTLEAHRADAMFQASI